MKEIWKDIPGYERYYQASTFGRIKSLDRVVPHRYSGKLTLKGKILKPQINSNGYYQLPLCGKGGHKTLRVHQLVARTFIPNPENRKVINHKDTNKLNNHVENLEWTTSKGNSIHAHENGLIDHARGVRQAKAKLTDEQVVEMRKLREQGWQYKDIAKVVGLNTHATRWACTGQTWAHVDYPPAPFRRYRKL